MVNDTELQWFVYLWKNIFFFWSAARHAACGILVPQPGIESRPLAVNERSPNHWPAREFPPVIKKKKINIRTTDGWIN